MQTTLGIGAAIKQLKATKGIDTRSLEGYAEADSATRAAILTSILGVEVSAIPQVPQGPTSYATARARRDNEAFRVMKGAW